MPGVARLITFADLREGSTYASASVSARHEAVLTDGRRVLIFDDRGWSWSAHRGSPGQDTITLDPWISSTLEEIERTARVVVGPDEPRPGQTQDEAAAAHWWYVADLLDARGAEATPRALAHVPHDVVVSDALRDRVLRTGRNRES